jgi:sterol desaturase/sphingolipid hydroxylase (fatty acid hydroxylase superfamily)
VVFATVRRSSSSDVLGGAQRGWLSGALVVGTLGVVLWLERKRPLRRRVETRHDARNVVMSALSGAAIRITERPLTDLLTWLVHRRRWGLVKAMKLPPALEVLLAVILLDYTLYVWHVLTHRAPFLWRFHRVHHADLDLTASTALRFHFAEMILSAPWRAGQVLLIGVAPLSLSVWQTATVMAILFHHSNLKLPLAIEQWLCRLFMTPRMHGIHHSIVPDATNSNWSTILALPDYLHGTYRLNVPQREVTIGVPEYRDSRDLELAEIIAMPFGEQRPFWRLSEGKIPERRSLPVASPSELIG